MNTTEPVLQHWMHRRALPHSVGVCVSYHPVHHRRRVSARAGEHHGLRSHLGWPG